MEIDLPRMQSLSPQLDSPIPIESLKGMTNLSISDKMPAMNCTSNSSLDQSKNCDWELSGCKYTNKSGCGCKYINQVSCAPFH